MNIEKKLFVRSNWEYLLPILAALSLAIACVIVSSKKFFWNDELLSFYLLSDRSLPHMLVAWSDKFNQAPPLYFIAGWFWEKVFGSSELSLRLFSSLTLGLASLVVWRTLRRTYDYWSTTVGTLSVFCLSELIFYHNAEVRMYGLFTLFCALGFSRYDWINRNPNSGWKTLWVNSLIHGAIVLTHLYGILYSANILAAFIVRDRYYKTFRLPVYFSVVLGWLFLLPLVPLIIEQSNNHAKWYSRFTLSQTLNLLIPFSKFAWFILALLVISLVIKILKFTNDKSSIEVVPKYKEQIQSEFFLFLVAVFFLLVPLFSWLITVSIKPLLNDRYIIPTIAISWPILLAYFLSRILPAFKELGKKGRVSDRGISSKYPFRSILLASLTIAIILYPISQAKKFTDLLQKPGEADLKYGYTNLPIALEAGHDFLPRFYYSSKPSRYYHILDWETAVKNVESSYATGDYVHINAISTHYPFIQSLQSSEFLKKHDRFFVLNEEDQKWFEARIQNNSNYQIEELGTELGANAPLTMFLVKRKS